MKTSSGSAVSRNLRNRERDVITVWSDIGCPWATLCLHVLRDRLRQLEASVDVDHRVFPLEWFNRRPTPKWILDSEIAVIGGNVPELGWRPWRLPESQYPSSTIFAMWAVQAAKHQSVAGLKASDELDSALRVAFFREHRPISVLPVVYEIATECPNVDPEELERSINAGYGWNELVQQWALAQSDGVRCSPHVFGPSGFESANPGADYRWAGDGESRFPVLDHYATDWVEVLLKDVI